jgi:hypothetical protein
MTLIPLGCYIVNVRFHQSRNSQKRRKNDDYQTHVYWDFVPLSSTQTKVSLTIVIGLPNPTIKFLGSLFGSEKLWRNHLTEELVNMGRIMEQDA